MSDFNSTIFSPTETVWKPHVTVAAIIEHNHRFLLVEEHTDRGLSFNQPAGHLEENEDFISAVRREVREETAWLFEPEFFLGVQLWRRSPASPTFVRLCFTGSVYDHDPSLPLDDGIVQTHWLSRDEIEAHSSRLRSPLVLRGIDEYLRGIRFPLSILQAFIDLDHV